MRTGSATVPSAVEADIPPSGCVVRDKEQRHVLFLVHALHRGKMWRSEK